MLLHICVIFLSHYMITGPPAAPIIEVTAMQRSVIIEWFTPFSLIPITQYTVEITTDGVIVNTQLLEPSDPPLINSVTIQSLDPFTLYVATVIVVNRAGSNNASSQFTTLQAGMLIAISHDSHVIIHFL